MTKENVRSVLRRRLAIALELSDEREAERGNELDIRMRSEEAIATACAAAQDLRTKMLQEA
ncbi:MAG: hypothetical protein CMO04_12475 [Thalassospira sp.]|nr:hypothetical protein [Thalassospira sp.]|tara:strand:+ start:599 stop:781 length:183 start_codon:yes stop_codon:yes gene_type:complete